MARVGSSFRSTERARPGPTERRRGLPGGADVAVRSVSHAPHCMCLIQASCLFFLTHRRPGGRGSPDHLEAEGPHPPNMQKILTSTQSSFICVDDGSVAVTAPCVTRAENSRGERHCARQTQESKQADGDRSTPTRIAPAGLHAAFCLTDLPLSLLPCNAVAPLVPRRLPVPLCCSPLRPQARSSDEAVYKSCGLPV